MALPNDPATTPNIPQADTASNTWDPSTISNVIFSAIMVFIGIIAIWQAHRAHRRSIRALDQEELIGIQLLSRASTMLSNASHNVNIDPPTLLSRQATLITHGQEHTGELRTPNGAEILDGADVRNDTAAAIEPCS